MKIVVGCRKGGVGKTTIVAGLASLFAEEGLSVLAVDLDPQSNLALAFDTDTAGPGTSDLLLKGEGFPIEINENIHILVGGAGLRHPDIMQLDPSDLDFALKDWDYDVMLFDCPPGNEELERLAIAAATHALVIIDPHPFAIVGAERIINTLKRRKDRNQPVPGSWGIIANRIDKRRSLDQEIEEISQELGEGEEITHFKLRQDAKLSQATAEGILLTQYAPNSNAVKDLTKVKEWIIGKKSSTKKNR